MRTYYTVYQPRDQYDYESNAQQLTAKTDTGARRQARKIARENGWKKYFIKFYRESDSCIGNIDI